jgi:hypothetical protein
LSFGEADMQRRSPTLEGFRAIFRQPSFGLAEISWRWTFGAMLAALCTLGMLAYLDTLPVTRADEFLLRTRHPFLISQAIGHILQGSGPRFVAATLVLAVTLSLAWVAIATLGRAVSVKFLLSHVRNEDSETVPFRLRSLAGLNSLRVGAFLALVVSCMGAMVLGGMASSDKDPSPGSAMLIFLTVLMLASMAWAVVNWFLSLAAVFVVAQGQDTFGAITATVDFFRRRTGAVLAASTWFGLAHGVAFFVATSVVAFPLALAAVLPGAVVFGGVLLVTLLYFAVVDFLYVGRLAAYVYIAEEPEADTAQIAVVPPDGPPLAGVDRDELILSDVPLTPEPGAAS